MEPSRIETNRARMLIQGGRRRTRVDFTAADFTDRDYILKMCTKMQFTRKEYVAGQIDSFPQPTSGRQALYDKFEEYVAMRKERREWDEAQLARVRIFFCFRSVPGPVQTGSGTDLKVASDSSPQIRPNCMRCRWSPRMLTKIRARLINSL